MPRAASYSTQKLVLLTLVGSLCFTACKGDGPGGDSLDSDAGQNDSGGSGADVGNGGNVTGGDGGVNIDGSSNNNNNHNNDPRWNEDDDNDGLPNGDEDRNRNGTVDPGETDPKKADTDGDGIPDDREVGSAACNAGDERKFQVYDFPGADSMFLVDDKVSVHSTLRTPDNKAPGGVVYDPALQAAAALVGKRPANGVATPSAQRDYEQRQVIRPLGNIVNQRTRAFTTVEGFTAEQAVYRLNLNAETDSASLVNELAKRFLGGAQLTGTLAAGTTKSSEAFVSLLTVFRSPSLVVLVAGVVVGTPSDAQILRVDEFTDGTNVARHNSFTRHVCDPFVVKEALKADILWVVDDSGSMADDQEAVRAAADAMADVLSSADVDYRLGVARMFASLNSLAPQRGLLEGSGLTRDLEEFKDNIVVGAEGGWEPGLEVGIKAIRNLEPRTEPSDPERPNRLRSDAATVVVYLSDERDQEVECAACGTCNAQESQQTFCTEPRGQVIIDRYIAEYKEKNAVAFAIVGDLPNGCQQTTTRDDFEPGQGYVEVANGTGGQFGSLCGDMRQNVEDIARGATGVASTFQLSTTPASATIKVVVGAPGQPREISRSRENGFDFDPVSNKIIFYGDARPARDSEVVVGYRRWDFADNPNTPPDPCDDCLPGTGCNPEIDILSCQPTCGDTVCENGQVCVPDTATCGTPTDPIPPVDGCTTPCTGGRVCNPATDSCVLPCEQTGCSEREICNTATHLCQIPNF